MSTVYHPLKMSSDARCLLVQAVSMDGPSKKEHFFFCSAGLSGDFTEITAAVAEKHLADPAMRQVMAGPFADFGLVRKWFASVSGTPVASAKNV